MSIDEPVTQFRKSATTSLLTRREMVGLGALIVGGSTLAIRHGKSDSVTIPRVTVLAPILPDPAPPGVIDYLMPGLELWESANGATVYYDATAVDNMKSKILINIRGGYYVHDVMYCSGWAQEISQRLAPLDSLIGPTLRADLFPSSLTSFQWQGKLYGVPVVSNPMILYRNSTMAEKLGQSRAPDTWDDLLAAAKAATGAGSWGWIMPAGQTGGHGGLMSSWQVFFLQAGGRLFDSKGAPDFANDAGVAAVEMLQKLLPYSGADPFAVASLQDATVAFLTGKTAMMMNWAMMYQTMTDPDIGLPDAPVTSVLPAGPVGHASIDSGDGWTIDSRSWQVNRGMSLIQYYLQPSIQVQMYEQTGWLPASLSALRNPLLTAKAPHAAAVADQMHSRIESGFRPNYDVVTQVIGSAVQKALLGEVTPITALRSAEATLTNASAAQPATT